MLELDQYHDRLRTSIPYRYRYEVESILRAFHHSHVMLEVYTQGLKSILNTEEFAAFNPVVIAFGSFGRLDGATNISDYDIMFIYQGKKDGKNIELSKKLIRRIISSNVALNFDHREAICNGSFAFDASKAYPIISEDELTGAISHDKDTEVRALQILTEGRCLNNEESYIVIANKLLSYFGFSNNIHKHNLVELKNALTRLKTEYLNGVIVRISQHGGKMTNRKLLKLFSLREFTHLANLFSLAEISLSVANRQGTVSDAIKVLGAPSILKIASFADGNRPLGVLLSGLAPEVKRDAGQIAESYIRALPREVAELYFRPGIADEDSLSTNIRVLAINVLRRFNDLLGLLHDHEFLGKIDKYEPVYANWVILKPFQSVMRYRNELVENAKTLSKALLEISTRACQHSRCDSIDEAIAIYKEIVEYTIESNVEEVK
ncbi:MAG: hypothetical protein QM703_11525 [Gemmatales bacterium]